MMNLHKTLTIIAFGLAASSQAAAIDFITEDEFPERFEAEVLPFWEAGLSGFITGSPQKVLFGNKEVKLAYKAFFQDDAKANIFIVHGFNNFKEIFRELSYDFYRDGYNVIAYDLRGHGRSTRLSSNVSNVYFDSYNKQAMDLKILVDQFGSNGLKNFVYSFSMGGLITSVANQEYPELIDGVVMTAPLLGIETAPYPKGVAFGLAAVATAIGLGDQLAPGQNGPVGEPGPFEGSITKSRVRWDALTAYKFAPENVAEVNIAGATNNWVYQTLKTSAKVQKPKNAEKSHVPVLLFQAADDTVVLLPDQNNFCEVLLDCELRVLENSRHFASDEIDEVRIPLVTQSLDFFESLLD